MLSIKTTKGGGMSKQNIAIIGLGRIGSAFLGAMLQKKQNINLVCVAETADTPAKAQAVANGLKIATIDEIVVMGEKIDIIFELTGIAGVRKELREKLLAANNSHTVIASETIARLIGALISDAAMPVIQGRKTGY
jgi:predicted dinucleotide-utilizing enzyme